MENNKKNKKDFHSGFVAIIGKPNVGKSTLMNSILGQKISIVTHKPQTTRNRIIGVKNLQEAQIIFIDTPGIHKASIELNRKMLKVALNAVKEADVVIYIIDADSNLANEEEALQEVINIAKPPILLINKIDLIKDKRQLLPLIKEFDDKYAFAEIIPISALIGDGIDKLLNEIVVRLPLSPPLYPEDMVTDRAERFLVAELIREQIILKTKQEIPYSVAIDIESWEESKNICKIGAVIFIERESQKGIVIGKKGDMLKEIGTLARKEIEKLLGCQIHLSLWVKVQPSWRRDPMALRRFGYDETSNN